MDPVIKSRGDGGGVERKHFQTSYRHLMPVSIPLAQRLVEGVAEWTPGSSPGVTN